MLLEGKVALITGAGSGMSKAQAQKYAIAIEGAKVIAVKGDISNKEKVDQFVKEGLDKYKRIDILSNTAGIKDDFKPTLDVTEEFWDKVMNINLKGMFLTNRVLP